MNAFRDRDNSEKHTWGALDYLMNINSKVYAADLPRENNREPVKF